MDESGNTRDDLFLPKGTDEADKLAEIMQQHWSDNKEMAVTVVKVCAVEWCSREGQLKGEQQGGRVGRGEATPSGRTQGGPGSGRRARSVSRKRTQSNRHVCTGCLRWLSEGRAGRATRARVREQFNL